MPIYEWRCPDCKGRSEHMMSYEKSEIENIVICADCEVPKKKIISLPAKTATLWNGGWNKGLAAGGFYSPSVGDFVSSKREEETIMNSRGYINEKDLGGEGFYESYTSKKKDEMKELDSTSQTYRDNLKKFGGDKVRAVTETFPAHEMLKQANEHDSKIGAA